MVPESSHRSCLCSGLISMHSNKIVYLCLLYFQDCAEFSARVSFLEIYNEELFDLLASGSLESQKLRLFEDATKKVLYFANIFFLQGLIQFLYASTKS